MMSDPKQIILVTGGSRSGKSEWAETLANNTNKPVTYIPTSKSDPMDQEWQKRILQHQQRRPDHWQMVVDNENLDAIITQALKNQCILIDSLGTWVAHFLELKDHSWQETTDKLLFSLEKTRGSIILVGEETGWGIVPAYKSGRIFRDRLGHLTRQIGAIADTTYLVIGGHVLNLNVLGTPLGINP